MEDFFYLYMEELTLTTPALLFSAVSLILLAYTNRFLSYAQLVRQLRDRYMENPTDITVAQIENLRKRLNLTRTMQGLGIASLFLCVVSMFFIYIGLQLLSAYVFGVALLLLIASLGVSFREIQISTRSLEIYLGTMEKERAELIIKPPPNREGSQRNDFLYRPRLKGNRSTQFLYNHFTDRKSNPAPCENSFCL
ncbi:hypothetical protein KUBF_45940 [Bacteroides finegoldii]|nr:hypothetical protein KUBF_45940 [Bacteroides finegoldii]